MIGLIDVDSHNYPNLVQMKLSAFYKSVGEQVERWDLSHHYEKVFISKVFDDTYTQDWTDGLIIDADEIVRGGTGYDLQNTLPAEIEHIMPDYSIYGITDHAYGFLSRGCPRHCSFCIVGDKEGLKSRKHSDLDEWWSGESEIDILDPNILACPERMSLLDQLIESGASVDINQGLDIRLMTEEIAHKLKQMKIKRIHFAWDNPNDNLEPKCREYAKISGHSLASHGGNGTVYVLVNHGSTLEEDLMRIYTLRSLCFRPYVMVFDKPHAPKTIRRLQRWCNNPFVFYKCPDFNDYKKEE